MKRNIIIRFSKAAVVRSLSGILFLVYSLQADGQAKEILTTDRFIEQVKLYHPLARQAGILVEKAEASLLAARGNFDPVFEMNYDDKTFTGVNYYRYNNPEIKLPLINGVTVKSGIEDIGGAYTNPELSKGVTSYLGVEVSLLKGLLTDKQRTMLRQAKVYKKQSEQEQENVLNDLLLDAYVAYWHWAAGWQLYNVYTRYLDLAQKRMNLVRTAFNNGDRSMADTIEAYTQLQQYNILRNEAAVALNYSYYELALYLWNERQEPYLLADNYMPDINSFNTSFPLPALDSLEKEMIAHHPLLSAYALKTQTLEMERKLKWQNLLPVVNVKANLLTKDYYSNPAFTQYYLSNNYKLGLNVKVPLFLRQARGELRQAKLKIKENNLSLVQKTAELRTKLKKYYNEFILYDRQIKAAAALKSNYASLLKMEEIKFTQGESSLFLVNSRENKLLETEQKLIELTAKYFKAYYALHWVAGVLN